MQQMHPNSKASTVMRILSEGPATTGEVAAELGWHVRLACAHLSNLRRQKKIVSEPFHRETGGRPGQLWRVMEHAA